jgi:hypothetical protein
VLTAASAGRPSAAARGGLAGLLGGLLTDAVRDGLESLCEEDENCEGGGVNKECLGKLFYRLF